MISWVGRRRSLEVAVGAVDRRLVVVVDGGGWRREEEGMRKIDLGYKIK